MQPHCECECIATIAGGTFLRTHRSPTHDYTVSVTNSHPQTVLDYTGSPPRDGMMTGITNSHPGTTGSPPTDGTMTNSHPGTTGSPPIDGMMTNSHPGTTGNPPREGMMTGHADCRYSASYRCSQLKFWICLGAHTLSMDGHVNTRHHHITCMKIKLHVMSCLYSKFVYWLLSARKRIVGIEFNTS